MRGPADRIRRWLELTAPPAPALKEVRWSGRVLEFALVVFPVAAKWWWYVPEMGSVTVRGAVFRGAVISASCTRSEHVCGSCLSLTPKCLRHFRVRDRQES